MKKHGAVTRNDQPRTEVFTDRELGLLVAWDVRNRRRIDDTFEERVMSAVHEARHSPFNEAPDARAPLAAASLMQAMADEAAEVCQQIQASSTGRLRGRTEVDPDSDVMELVARGDLSNAIQRLMMRHGSGVYRYCREALRDAALADDVHQQVFIAAFRDLPRFRRRSTVRTWLFGIARHRVLDGVKRQARSTSRVNADADVASMRPSPAEALDDARLQHALSAAVAELPEAMRAAVLLHYQQGLTFEEMAPICGEKPGTLQARVARALRMLRNRIEGQ